MKAIEVVGTLGTNNQCMCNVCAIFFRKFEGKTPCVHLGVDERIILKCVDCMGTIKDAEFVK
jgi:hypothetical protein